MSSVVVDFDIYPRQIMSGQTIRCFDQSVYSGIYKWYQLFVIEENKPWTVSTPPSSHINMANANTLFSVGDLVVVKSSASDLPAGLSPAAQRYFVITATSTYLELSLSPTGSAISYTDAGSGTLTISHACVSFSGTLIKPCPVSSATSLDVTLYVYDCGAGLHTLAKAGFLRIYPTSTAVTKPTSSLYGKVSIFIYDGTNATVINRRKNTNNPFFFQKFKVTGSMNRAGTAKFTVVDMGSATATDKGLIVADKNVAIILGHNVIWSGKILRAVQGKMSLYDTAVPFSSWSVECESDISKMKLQPVKAANKGEYQETVGHIINKLVENSAATDIDWRGVVEKGLIQFSGPEINFTITDADMYTQFIALANYSGYDWRTRNNFVKYLYGSSGYNSSAKTVTLSAITPYASPDFVGRWLLFTNDVNADTSSNTEGVRSYGKITSHTGTVITMTTIVNSTIPSASNGNVIILGDPVLDFAIDLRQPSYQCTFTGNKTRETGLQNAYEVNDKSDFKLVTTKVTAKAKSQFVNPLKSLTGKMSATETATLIGKDKFDNSRQYFNQSTFISQKTSAWIYSYAANATSVVLIGHNLIIRNADILFFSFVRTNGVSSSGNWTVSGTPTEQTQPDGTPTTTVTLTAAPDTSNWMRYGVVSLSKLFVNDNNIYINGSGILPINIGTTSVLYVNGANIDPIYGPYLSIAGLTLSDNHPHLPGCLVSMQTYTEAAPETDSPIDLFGDIQKTITVDQNVSEPELEVYATGYLLNHSNYYKKGGFWSIFYDWFKTDLRPTNQVTEAGWINEGDLIALLQNTADTALDIQYGQYKNQWQVLAWTLDTDKMAVTCELGDFETNMNTLINDKTAGTNYTIT